MHSKNAVYITWKPQTKAVDTTTTRAGFVSTSR